ncbi:hypothetical protein GCM10009597_01020 [Peribacillus frigoritolerans]
MLTAPQSDKRVKKGMIRSYNINVEFKDITNSSIFILLKVLLKLSRIINWDK